MRVLADRALVELFCDRKNATAVLVALMLTVVGLFAAGAGVAVQLEKSVKELEGNDPASDNRGVPDVERAASLRL